jgi:two-component system OmpR family sensor kinase
MKFLHSNRSMRARMTWAFTLSIGVLLLIGDATVIAYSRYAANRTVERLLVQSARELEGEWRESRHVFTPLQLARSEGNELGERGINLIFFDRSGKILFAPKKFRGEWPPNGDEIWRSKRVALDQYSAVLAVPWSRRTRELNELAWLLAALSTLVLAACALGAWLLVGRVLAPLSALSQQAQTASTLDLHARLVAPSDDLEMTVLVRTLNDLLARLEADARSKARFYAAASHELRTPLQSLSGFLELGLARPRPVEELRVTLQEASAQSSNLIVLVNDLLMLNQLETAMVQQENEDVDMADVAERALQKLDASMAQKNLRANFQTANVQMLSAPWTHLEMLVRNLLENAVKYSQPDSELKIECGAQIFEVENRCPKIEGWDEEKIFEPFFRPDVSRTSQTGGNGLGLAICKAICDANGWKLCVQQIEGGVCARVEFSAAKQAGSTPAVRFNGIRT